jgi:shikimate dehydrogenase
VACLALHDADARRRDRLIARLAPMRADIIAGSPDPTGFDLVINATPMGMNPDDPLPIEAEKMRAGAFAADVVTSPERTRFLEKAAARGCGTQVGTAMFAAQADYIADFLLAAPRGP